MEKNKGKEELLQEAGEESFPASDPPPWTLGSSKKPVENDQTDTISVKCKQCGQAIPRSVAEAPESKDYVSHFCCENCHSTWEKQNKEAL